MCSLTSPLIVSGRTTLSLQAGWCEVVEPGLSLTLDNGYMFYAAIITSYNKERNTGRLSSVLLFTGIQAPFKASWALYRKMR